MTRLLSPRSVPVSRTRDGGDLVPRVLVSLARMMPKGGDYPERLVIWRVLRRTLTFKTHVASRCDSTSELKSQRI